MFLWSPDMEAVLVVMSCFRHLSEEAHIRCGVDEVPIQTILPNYNTFIEFASVSTMMATGGDEHVHTHTHTHTHTLPLGYSINGNASFSC